MNTQILSALLDVLEQKEAKLLSWGVTSGGFAEEEIEQIIDQFVSEQSLEDTFTTSDLKKGLLDAHLLFRLPSRHNHGGIFRTRSAETIRLLDDLKQILPLPYQRRKSQEENIRVSPNWRTASNLVADYRYSLRPRVFPKRTITKEAIFERLEELKLLTDWNKQILKDLLHSEKDELLLADFQVEAIVQMLGGLKGRRDKGMIITAGTGSGKTYGFYLPALMHIASAMGSKSCVNALALYPRKELLIDQFTNAYRLALKINRTVKKVKNRSLSIGAYFAATPIKKEYIQLPSGRRSFQAWLCPYLKCPDCEGNLYWKAEDIQRNRHVLVCREANCLHQTPDEDILRLTRDSITSSPPDLLFTTTESLNRLMSDTWSFHIIGLGKEPGPDLVLLDEVHTYAGIHGAQVANLLRRWKHRVEKKIFFTGLSATLENASNFFADMVGIPKWEVVELKPLALEQKGMEYLVALRGDPVSGTALLSTTIQTIMLLRRVLEPNDSGGKIFGKKVFAFTDNLDVTNRLFHNLLDAEGYEQNGGGGYRPTNLPLAFFRKETLLETRERFHAGQSWRIAEELHHALSQNLLIDRVSSQDSGVNSQADVVIATASLEVGYDDNQVGAVIQHKTPRDLASFLQRKGRGGRSTQMRPWTVVTLSDYGRDRITYQSYEQIFSPTLPERNLPIRNKYVLRIQAALTLMDWVSAQLSQEGTDVKLWNDLVYNEKRGNELSYAQKKILHLIEDLLNIQESNYLQYFLLHLKQSLQLEEDEVYDLCWEEPRPLLTGVLPSLYRKLKSNWSLYATGNDASRYPLVEFIPASLFADLSIPEVEILLDRPQEGEVPAMSIEQALKEFAPGKVSRRYGVERMGDSHWIPVSTEDQEDEYLDVHFWYPRKEFVGDFPYRDEEGHLHHIPCFRPYSLRLQTLSEDNVKPSSNSYLVWRSYIQLPKNSNSAFQNITEKIAWHKVLPKIGLFTHRSGNPLSITRFAIGSNANISLRDPDVTNIAKYVRFSNQAENEICSLGYSIPVDGICFLVNLPDNLIEQAVHNASLLKGIKISYFKHLLTLTQELNGLANDFQRDWLAQAFVAALTVEATTTRSTTKEAFEHLKKSGIANKMVQAFDVLFGIAGGDEGELERQRRHQELVDLCWNPIVIGHLEKKAPCLWEEPSDDLKQWLPFCVLSTLGAALLEACYQLTPNFENSEILVDIEVGNSPIISSGQVNHDSGKIWITETTLGGGGVIESICQQYEENPQQFFHLLESALQASDFELADSQLQEILRLIHESDWNIINSMQEVREASSHEALEQAYTALHNALQHAGILTVNTFNSALNVRLLRTGSTPESDQLMIRLMQEWNEIELRLGLELDARLFAYIASQNDELVSLLQNIVETDNSFGTLYGLLWPRGHVLRMNALKVYNPFQTFAPADRLLVSSYFYQKEIDIHDPEWHRKINQALLDNAEVTLVGTRKDVELLKQAIFSLQLNPVELDVLLLYPQISGIFHDKEKLKVKVTLPENVF